MEKYTNVFESLGLAKNEARIYEVLLKEGESGVGKASSVSGVHRRNVYDSLNRLIERGLVFERMTSKEHLYQATDPKKLSEIVQEKKDVLQDIMPDLENMYLSVPHEDDVVVYRGIEGWKNYLRDIVRIGQDVYTFSAKGTWQDERLSHVVAQTIRESKKKKMKFHFLFDGNACEESKKLLEKGFDAEWRFLPKGFDTQTTVDVFGDHVVIVSDPKPGAVMEDRSIVMLINPQTADAFRVWFRLLWKMSSK